ncbi:MAG: WD40 repeat domain-containing protein [Planctomycetota bacterium]|jgi:WD40 repeat protein
MRRRAIGAAAMALAAVAWTARAQEAAPAVEAAAVLTGHTGTVTTARFAPDGARLLTAGSDANVRTWSADGKADVTLLGHTGVVWTAEWSPDGGRILSGGRDGTGRLWNAGGGEALQVMHHGRPGAVMRVRWINDELAWFQGGNRVPQLWQVRTGAKAGDLAGHGDVVWSIDVAQQRWLVSGGQDRTARLWDLQNGQTARIFGRDAMQAEDGGHAGAGSPVFAVAIAPDAMTVATGHREGQVKLWSSRDESLVGPERRHAGGVLVARFTPDGKWLVTGSADHTVGLWEVAATESGKAGRRLSGHTDWVQALDVSADGSKLVTGDWKGGVRFWSLPDGKLLGAGTGHTGRITAVHISADGTRAVTASGDGTARIWKLP